MCPVLDMPDLNNNWAAKSISNEEDDDGFHDLTNER